VISAESFFLCCENSARREGEERGKPDGRAPTNPTYRHEVRPKQKEYTPASTEKNAASSIRFTASAGGLSLCQCARGKERLPVRSWRKVASRESRSPFFSCKDSSGSV